jgi:hypothetical protein
MSDSNRETGHQRWSEGFDIDRVVEWINSESRKSASAAFTAGGERQVAYLVEIERRRVEAKFLAASERIAELERERDRLRRVIDECQCGCHETGETHSGMRRTIADLRVRLNFLKSKGLTVTKMTDQNGERWVYVIADDSELDDKPTVNKLFAAEIALTQSQQQCEAMEQLYRDCRKSLWSYDAQDPEIFDAETTANIARAKASTHSETAKPE